MHAAFTQDPNNHIPFNPGFPVYIYEEGLELPAQGVYFVVAGNGLFLHKDTGVVQAFVPVDNISILQELDAKTWVHSHLPKVPPSIILKIKEFFRLVVEKYHSEAEVTLYYNKETKEFLPYVSEQSVSMGGVQYKRKAASQVPGMENCLRVGTIHSHCDFGAFHSGTDVGDEEDFDGIHLTFGHNDKEEFTIAASIVVNGHRAKVDPLTLAEGIELVKPAGEEENENISRFFAWKGHSHKKDAVFRLIEVDEETKKQWVEGVEEWIGQIRTAPVFRPRIWGEEVKESPAEGHDLEKGESVVWASNLNTQKWEDMCGEGPFDVVRVEGPKIVIRNKNDKLVRFPARLFERPVLEVELEPESEQTETEVASEQDHEENPED